MNLRSIIKTTLISALLLGTSAFADFKPVRIAHYTGVLCSAPVHVAWLMVRNSKWFLLMPERIL